MHIATQAKAHIRRPRSTQRPKRTQRRKTACLSRREGIRTAQDQALTVRGARAVASDEHGSTRQRKARLSTVARALQRQRVRGPPKRRLVRPKHQPAASLPCTFRSFSNGGQANSACGRGMAQSRLSMAVMANWARIQGGIRMRRHLVKRTRRHVLAGQDQLADAGGHHL